VIDNDITSRVWPEILSDQPAKYLSTLTDEATSTILANTNGLPEQSATNQCHVGNESCPFSPVCSDSNAANSSTFSSRRLASLLRRAARWSPVTLRPHAVS
jgi:hypothetical protein